MSARQRPGSHTLGDTPKPHPDPPLRAKSVCLSERPRSRYLRSIRSADPNSSRYADKQYIHRPFTSNLKTTPKQSATIPVRQVTKKIIEKPPCTLSVQTLSIPMKYASNPQLKRSTSTDSGHLFYNEPCRKTKTSNPMKQVNGNRRLCDTVGCGKGTENKLLVQISEAEQVADFERILNSNAILWERGSRHVWRGSPAASASTASLVSRPRSSFSLSAISHTYNFLYQQHEDNLQPVIDAYHKCQPVCLKPETDTPSAEWCQDLQDLSKFYEDDLELRHEIETITDSLICEKLNVQEERDQTETRNKNFNVNLTDLIGVHVNEDKSDVPSSELTPSLDVDGVEQDISDAREWPASGAMSDNCDHEPLSRDINSVDTLAQNFNSVKIDNNEQIPTITLSNCEGCARPNLPNKNDVVIHLAVPSIESTDESRPPMM